MKISKKALKTILIIVSVAAVCTIAWVALYKSRVMGAYKEYVKGDPSTSSTLSENVITEAGGTRKGAAGSLKESVAESVPTAGYLESGEDSAEVRDKNGKGGERNPFVILEIVPDKAMQQMTYLNACGSSYPIDWMQIGIDENANFINMKADSNEFNNLSLKNSIGYWVSMYQYGTIKFCPEGMDLDVYEENPQYEEKGMRLVEPGKLIDHKFSDDEVEENGYDIDEFYSYYKNNHTMADIQKKYPKLFPNEATKQKNAIRDIAIKDEKNWVKEGGLKYSQVEGGNTVTAADAKLTISEIAAKYPSLFKEDSDGKKISNKDLKDSYWKKEYTESTTKRSIQTSELIVSDDDFNSLSVRELAAKYPAIFKVDVDGKKISDSMIQDDEHWRKKTSSNSWEKINPRSGYMVNVGAGKGTFCLNWSNSNQWYSSIEFGKNTSESRENQWIYVTEEPTGGKYRSLHKEKDFYDILNHKLFLQDDSYVGGYIDLSQINSTSVSGNRYTLEYSVTKTQYIFTCNRHEYHYEYYGLKGNDVLKRSLFAFRSQEEADNFHLEVICMTPSEVNELCKKENDPDDEKLDIIERADLFYIASYDSATVDVERYFKFYQKYVDNKYTYNMSKIKSFVQDDLEWDVIIKLLKRVSDNPNLALMFNKQVGRLVDSGEESVDMYCGPHQNGDKVSWISTVNNIGKLYLMTLQFDLQAGTKNASKKIEYERTMFGEDGIINRIYKVPLSDEVKKANGNSAQYTGYFKPDVVYSDKAYYLWNRYTFYPFGVKNGSDPAEYEKYGYVLSYVKGYPFEKDNNNNESRENHLEGTDGDSDENNVTVVRGGDIANDNRSSMITLTEGVDIVNNMTEILYKIMHNGGGDPAASSLTLQVMKQKKLYTKVGDTQVLLDYSKDGKYKDPDKTLYIKVSIANPPGNLEPGVLKSVDLINDAEDSIDKPVPLKAIGGDALVKEDVMDIFGEDTYTKLNGYKVSLEQPLEVYIPYKLSDWQKGYTTLRFKLQGMTYYAKKKKAVVQSSPSTVDVLIDERALFSLR